MTYELFIHHGGLHVFRRQTLFEIEQLVDNYSRKLPSGPWLLRRTTCDDIWTVERIDCKLVGHVRKLQEGA